jgi:hypothetical protein
MRNAEDEFTRFEHEGWERVANKYDSVWSSLTRQFIPYLIQEAQVSAGMSVLDVACGPDYVSDAVRKLGANPPAQSPGAKIVNNAIEAHADLNVQLPQGPPRYLYDQKEECRGVLEEAGFDGHSMIYETRSVEWHLPTAHYFFEAERDAGVRTAGLLARQSPERLNAIRAAIENGVRRYARGNEFVIPMASHIVVVSKG